MKKSKFTEEQIVRILAGSVVGSKTQAQLCRDHGISPNTFYIWKRKYAGLQIDDLRLMRELERENAHLKRLLAERDLEIDAVRALFLKHGLALPEPVTGARFLMERRVTAQPTSQPTSVLQYSSSSGPAAR